MPGIVEVTDKDFREKVIEKSQEIPVVVDFWAPWCQPCLVLGPVLEHLVEQHKNKLILAKINVQANQSVASQFGIRGIPAVKMFRDGEVVNEFTGLLPEEKIKEFLEKAQPSEAENLIKQGDEYLKNKSIDMALEAYENALEKESANEIARYKIGLIFFYKKDFEQSKKHLKVVNHLENAKRFLSIIYFKQLPVRDIDELKQKLKVNPQDMESHLKLAEEYAKNENYRMA
ncbi:unnamed protein product, partial [marine sediment metagenome]